ncbi:MAG: hypothetical protein JWR28_2706 [Modestobacter sp.]|nr:hypothetical protein [Modestobacter sp.]
MSALRRNVLLVAIAVVTILGLTANAAQAAFEGKATMTTLTVGTITVAPPTELSTAGTNCTRSYYWANGTWNVSTTLHAKVSWKASATTRGVSGYRVIAWFPDGSSYPLGDLDAATTSVAMDVDGSYANQDIRVTVTTLTNYGWTTQSTKSGAFTC